MAKIILASTSPRRRELLGALTKNFTVIAPAAEEINEGEPKKIALKNAIAKGKSVEERCDVLIACDTVVALDGRVYGKPLTAERAVAMLRELRGRTHTVVSGVYLRAGEKEYAYTEESGVELRDLSDEEIARYVEACKPFDKAGAYGIQDGLIVRSYTGDYDNIVGLPMRKIREVFIESGYAE